MTNVAFFLDNPVSDLDSPDCLSFHASLNKIRKRIDPSVHHLQDSLCTASICLCAGFERPHVIDGKLVLQIKRTRFGYRNQIQLPIQTIHLWMWICSDCNLRLFFFLKENGKSNFRVQYPDLD